VAVTPEEADEFISENGTVASHLAVAEQMVDDYIGDLYVPEKVRDLAVLTLAQELQLRQRSPGGITNFVGADVAPRVGKDPMTPIYSILSQYVVGMA
jgi:hypothetical protein